jgi:TolB-like protein
MDVLLCLAEAGGAVVERDDLLAQVWGDRVVNDEPLTRCIGELRRALGDSRSNPRYVKTIPKRGYQLVTPALPLEGEAQGEVPSRISRWFSQVSIVRKAAVGLGVILLAIVIEMGVERTLDGDIGDQGSSPETVLPDNIVKHSIVVLPFVDMSAEQDQAYMGDGVAEELLNLLARVRDLRVISRSSAFSLKGKPIDIREVAVQFDVAYVLEGSVRTSGDRIRITAQLVDGQTDTHIWSETYERGLDDVFAIQDEIAQAVVSKLRITLLGDAPRSRHTDPEAYALFLQGRSLHEQPGGGAMNRALDFYKAALDIDPAYVPAWVWLAAGYDDVINSIDLPRDEVVKLARQAIGNALAIDPHDPLALGMNALLIQAWDNDLQRAASEMQRALDLDPANPFLLRWSATILVALGRHDEAVRVTEYLFARDPIGNITRINLAETYMNAGRFDEAVHICEIEVALSSENSPCGARLIIANLYAGNPEVALELLQRVRPSRVYTRLAPMVLHGAGQSEAYEQAVGEILAAYAAGDTGLGYWIVNTFAFTGDEDLLYEWLERTALDGALNMAPGLSYFAAYENEPRFQRVMSDLGMAPADIDAIGFDLPSLSVTP